MRISLTKWLCVVLVVAVIFAAWCWLRPYEWRTDPAARFQIVGVEVTRDHSHHWIHIHLKPTGGPPHDWSKPVRLVCGNGRELEAADTRMSGSAESGLTSLWLKFWVEPNDSTGPLRLRLNDGVLVVKSTSGQPALGLTGRKYFNSTRW